MTYGSVSVCASDATQDPYVAERNAVYSNQRCVD